MIPIAAVKAVKGFSPMKATNKVLGALSVVDAAKTGIGGAAREIKSTGSVYDEILNNKRATEIINELYLEKQAGKFDALKARVSSSKNTKALLSGLQSGVQKLPIIAAPLVASVLINHNLRSDMAPVRPTNEELVNALRYKLHQTKDTDKKAWADTRESLQKLAGEFTTKQVETLARMADAADIPGYLRVQKMKPFLKDLKKDLPAKMIHSVAELAPAAALTWAVGKNLRGRGETIPTRRPEYLRQKAMRKYQKAESDNTTR